MSADSPCAQSVPALVDSLLGSRRRGICEKGLSAVRRHVQHEKLRAEREQHLSWREKAVLEKLREVSIEDDEGEANTNIVDSSRRESRRLLMDF